jgi:hypothetical protein
MLAMFERSPFRSTGSVVRAAADARAVLAGPAAAALQRLPRARASLASGKRFW